MTSLDLDPYVLLTLQAGAWAAVGMLVGAFHFRTLRWIVGLLTGGGGWFLPAAVQLARFAFLAGALAVVTIHFGALPLLSATTGILTARIGMHRWAGPS